MTDFTARDEGSIILLCPNTDAAQEWMRDNLQVEPWQYLGSNLAIDHRMFGDIAEGILEDGLTGEWGHDNK